MLPLRDIPGEYRFPIRLGVRRWRRGRSANQPESRCGDRERGHSVSLPRPAYPLESSSGSAGTFQRGHPATYILQDASDYCSTARHYRQAKYNSQNFSNITTPARLVNHLERMDDSPKPKAKDASTTTRRSGLGFKRSAERASWTDSRFSLPRCLLKASTASTLRAFRKE